MSLLEAALAYAGKGWRVFPVHTVVNGVCSCGVACDSPGKHPRTGDGFKSATLDPAQVTAWWTQWPDSNIGCATGVDSGLWVLDVDAKGSVDLGGGRVISEGDHSLRVLEQDHGALPETLTQTTGSGGRHFLFAYPKGLSMTNKRIAPAIDSRGEGGYILLPPSRHIAGTTYQWDNQHPPASLPIWLKDKARERKILQIVEDEGEVVLPGERNDYLFRVGSKLRGQGNGYLVIFGALQELNKKCTPPLDYREVERIARNAATQQINEATPEIVLPRGWATKDEPNDIPSGADLALSLRDLSTMSIPVLPPLVEGILDRGEGALFVGTPNVGKSWLTLQMALAVATGLPFLGHYQTHPGTVLIIDEEGHLRGDQERMRKLMKAYGVNPDDDYPLYFAIRKGVKLDTNEGRTMVQRMVERYNPSLVILDSLVRVHNGDENISREMARFFETSVRLMETTGVTILFTHHIRKVTVLDTPDLGELIRGSSEIRAWPDEIYVVKQGAKEEGQKRLELHHVKSRWREVRPPANVLLRITEDTASAEWDGDRVEEAEGTPGTLGRIENAIRDLERKHEIVLPETIAAQVGLATNTVSKHLKVLTATNRVTSKRRASGDYTYASAALF